MTAALRAPTRFANRRDNAIASASGSGTVVRNVRVTPPADDASVSTLLDLHPQSAAPPPWVEDVIQKQIPRKDEDRLLTVETLVRFAQTCGALPSSTPRPFVDVGDDATVGAEWDLGDFHLEFQIGNNSAVDGIVLETPDGSITEISLRGNLRTLVAVMSNLLKLR